MRLTAPMLLEGPVHQLPTEEQRVGMSLGQANRRFSGHGCVTCDNDSALALLLVAQTMSLEALFANSIHLAQLCFGSCSFLINCPRSAPRPGVSLCQPLPVTFLSSSHPLTSFYFRENLSFPFWSPPKGHAPFSLLVPLLFSSSLTEDLMIY